MEIGNEKNEKGNAIINYSFVLGDNYVNFGGKYYDPKSEKEKDAKNIAVFNTPEFNKTSNLYIQNSPIRKGMSCGDADHKNSNNIDPCTLEKYASEDYFRVVQNVNGKPVTTSTVVNSYGVQYVNGKPVKKVIGSISYTAALSVRYCKITVNNVFCDGTISVLESKIPGFENAAFVKVENNYLCSDSVKNELKKASIMDFLKNVLQKNNAQLTDKEILKEYFGVDDDDDEDDDDNAFKGETNFVFDVRDDSQNYEKKKKEDITHDSKVVIIRAHYEMTETVTWNNDEEWEVTGGYPWWEKLTDTNWHKDDVDYSDGKYVADIVYCIEDNATSSKNGNTNNEKNATDKLITSDGKYVEYKDRESLKLTAEEEALVTYLYESRNSGDYKYALNLAQEAFIDFRTTPIDENGKTYNTFKDYFLEKNVAGFGQATNDPRTTTGNISYTNGKDKYLGVNYKCDDWFVSATRTTTAKYDFTLKPFNSITGVKDNENCNLIGYDKLSYVLGGADILESDFLKTGYLIAMFSNGANDFDGIINGLVEGSAIHGGKEGTFGDGHDISDRFDAMKRVTNAFKDNSLYGMYLVVDKKYSNVNKDAYVSAIFDEIKSSKFAAVVEANMDQDESKENRCGSKHQSGTSHKQRQENP